MEQKVCEVCHQPIQETFYFCPNCGKKLKEAPLSTSTVKQLGLYIFSLLLPPLGLFPGFRYLRQKNKKARLVGVVILFITIVSTVVTMWLTLQVVNSFNKSVDEAMQKYERLGY